MRRNLPTGFIAMGDLHSRLANAYTRQRLSNLAGSGHIPGAQLRPSGKRWMFRDDTPLQEWIEATKARRKAARVRRYGLHADRQENLKNENFVVYVMKIERWFEDEISRRHFVDWNPEVRAVRKRMLEGVAEIYNKL